MTRAIQGFVSYFSNPVSDFPLAYHSELNYEDSIGAKRPQLMNVANRLGVKLEYVKRCSSSPHPSFTPMPDCPHITVTSTFEKQILTRVWEP